MNSPLTNEKVIREIYENSFDFYLFAFMYVVAKQQK